MLVSHVRGSPIVFICFIFTGTSPTEYYTLSLHDALPIYKRLSQEQLQQAQQSSARELVRGLAHEIKNPLGGLRGAAQLLSRELPKNELQDYTQIIIEQADRLRNLVDRLLGPQQRLQQKERSEERRVGKEGRSRWQVTH